jgi:hypothetical protein
LLSKVKKNATSGELVAGNAGVSLGGSSPHSTTNGIHDQARNNIADMAAGEMPAAFCFLRS